MKHNRGKNDEPDRKPKKARGQIDERHGKLKQNHGKTEENHRKWLGDVRGTMSLAGIFFLIVIIFVFDCWGIFLLIVITFF